MLLKKGQMGLIETVMVLIVFFIVIIIALVFYYKFYFQDIKTTGEEISLQNADVLLASITSLAEMQCSENLIEEDCVDVGKLKILNTTLNSEFKSIYSSIFKYKTIKFKQVYPSDTSNCAGFVDGGNCLWITYDNPKPSYKSKISVSTPVSLYYPDEEVYTVGKLVVEVYR